MNVLFSLYVLVLFFVLTPGILVTLPKNGSKMMVTAVHGVIFAVVLFLTGRAVWMMTVGAMEGFQEGMIKIGRASRTTPKATTPNCPAGQIRKPTPTCVPNPPRVRRSGRQRRVPA